MAFDPSNDAEITAGAQSLVMMKTNPATQSTATLPNTQGDALDLTSKDFGAFTEQVNISIASGTVQGKLVTIIFEDITESEDNIGGDNIFNLTYDGSDPDAWDTMTGDVEAGGAVTAAASRATVGLDTDITDTVAPAIVEVLSASAADVGQTVTVYGLDGANAVIREVLTLNGTAAVLGTSTFATAKVLGAEVSGTTTGIVTVRVSPGGATIMTIPAGANQTQGLRKGVANFVSGSAVTLVLDAAGTPDVIIVGTSTTGAVLTERFLLAGTTPVVGAGAFSTITAIVLGDVLAARTVTTTAQAAKTVAATQDTIQKVADFYNARSVGTDGFALVLVTGNLLFDPDNLDVLVTPVDIFGPANPGFKADLFAVIDFINVNSQFMTAVKSTGATGGPPSNTTAPVFLAGGIEGVTTFADFQKALNLLKQTRVNTIIPLTGDPAVHAATESHCAFMAGQGKSERDALVGIQNAGQTGVPTKTELKTQIVALNSRHLRAFAQTVDKFDSNGVRRSFQPFFGAVLLGGMQAGSPVGTSLTFKFPDILSFAQDSTWNPTDDADELIQAGLVMVENVEGKGRRVVRNITTHLTSNNLAFIEASTNEAANFAVFEFREAMEISVGKKGFTGTVNAAAGLAIKKLGLLVDETIITDHRALNIERIADVLEVSVEMAPVISINFVKTTAHLVVA